MLSPSPDTISLWDSPGLQQLQDRSGLSEISFSGSILSFALYSHPCCSLLTPKEQRKLAWGMKRWEWDFFNLLQFKSASLLGLLPWHWSPKSPGTSPLPATLPASCQCRRVSYKQSLWAERSIKRLVLIMSQRKLQEGTLASLPSLAPGLSSFHKPGEPPPNKSF